MRQSLRLYKQHDTDLIALQVMGVSISKLAKRVVESYANGVRVKMALPECGPVDMSDLKISRSDFTTKDKKTISLLQSIKAGKRPQFIKTLLRSSLLTPSLTVFFTDGKDIDNEENYIRSIDVDPSTLIDIPTINKKITFNELVENHEMKKEKSKEYRKADERGEIEKFVEPISNKDNADTKEIPEQKKVIEKKESVPLQENKEERPAEDIPEKTSLSNKDYLSIISEISDVSSEEAYNGPKKPVLIDGGLDEMMNNMMQEF